ncbi:MAG: hypothetical protein KatS3mg111_0916 [Pirellulaceae bacterium]|nr:MAG: hypothetical protein KatS3mg111_0083 [Pirellulaceae bacterium]GIW96757.1 MAG: hypothetical protein KatS3mg111_0090 [Pirellulaceae bacterium]GIW97583.1 MAG: hypothetical protein KatS3mg111_0916 [Pirellulaceae bacterium]
MLRLTAIGHAVAHGREGFKYLRCIDRSPLQGDQGLWGSFATQGDGRVRAVLA